MPRWTLNSGTLLGLGVMLWVFGPATAMAQSAGWPEGEGRDLVENSCSGCHQLSLIERSSGYAHAGWEELTLTMIDLSGSPELETISAYLASHFPPRDTRAPSLAPGDHKIGFIEWVSPTLGQRTRDPVEAPDGSIWWAGQWADLAGRIDLATGQTEEFPLPAGARPHTVTADSDGNIWYTGNGNATMGKLDPATGEVTVYPMPDPAASDPHSAIVDGEGTVWFTLQRANMIGRLLPDSGHIDLVTAPTANSRPYGIKLDSHGTPWVAANGSNRLYRVDPQSMEITEFELPDQRTTVRRLDFASDDTIWYVNSALGRLGHLDPATGEAREWDSPSGPGSHPYAIAVINDVVWYNESAQRPDALVRFDPVDETFQSWAIPSGGFHAGIVRHMRPTRDGNLLIHQSSTNRVILVEIGS
jgi:virginiamycin B lyase